VVKITFLSLYSLGKLLRYPLKGFLGHKVYMDALENKKITCIGAHPAGTEDSRPVLNLLEPEFYI